MWKAVFVAAVAALSLPLAAAERIAAGLSTRGTVIEAFEVAGPSNDSPLVVVIGGLRGENESVALVREQLRRHESTPPLRRTFRLVALPVANPDNVALQFPPQGAAYRENIESHVLWRWIGTRAPDLVLLVGREDFGLADALSNTAVAEVGRVPAKLVSPSHQALRKAMRLDGVEPSQARLEMERRRSRTPRQLAEELAQYYGRDFDQPWYIQAIALVARARLGAVDEVQRLVEPYVDGTRNSLARPNSLVLAGHMIFTELARKTGDQRYAQRVREAADLGFTDDGQPKEAMPFHQTFSDSVFMGTIVAAEAGALTGERKYFDMAARHVEYMQKIVLRPDGLYRHHASTDVAWGRGNAFPAIGLALALSEFPESHPARADLLRSFQSHMAALARYQGTDGLWRNVIDHPGAYPEYSATAMIGFAMLRGIRNAWLPAADYRPRVEKAWRAILERTGPGGHIVDGCESTATARTLADYLTREALLGHDPRSGAMAMMFAMELDASGTS